jgi:hypothetical protein
MNNTPILDQIETSMDNGIILLTIIIVLSVIIYFGIKFIAKVIKRHYYKQFRADQHKVDLHKQIMDNASKAHTNAHNSFIYYTINDDINNNINVVLSDKAKRLINIYKD